MSQYRGQGTNPTTNRHVDIFYGWDDGAGFDAGYFFQVYLPETDPDYADYAEDDGLICDKGFLNGIPKEEFLKLCKKFSYTPHDVREEMWHGNTEKPYQP